MRNLNSGSTYALLTILVSMLAPHALRAQTTDKQLKLPYDFKVDEDEDYIELDGDKKKPAGRAKSKPAPAPQPQARPQTPPSDPRAEKREPAQPRREQPQAEQSEYQYERQDTGDYADGGFRYERNPHQDEFRDERRQENNQRGDNRNIYGNPRRMGNECDGLRNGDYTHAQDLYTHIFEQSGRVFVTYPVFTIEDQTHRGGDMARGQNEQRQQAPSRFEPQFPLRGQLGIEYVLEDREVVIPACTLPLLDQYGRQLFELDPYGRPIRPAMQCIPARVVIEKVRVARPIGDGFEPQPNRPQRPQAQADGWRTQNSCVALPYLRTAEVAGARSVGDAQRLIERNGRSIKRSASNASRERTPQNLGPISGSDPGRKSK